MSQFLNNDRSLRNQADNYYEMELVGCLIELSFIEISFRLQVLVWKEGRKYCRIIYFRWHYIWWFG